jgi:hypothetical protein
MAQLAPPTPVPAAPVAAATADAPSVCPVCAEARPGPFARYCDTCRYDFLEKKPFSASPAQPSISAPSSRPPPASPMSGPAVHKTAVADNGSQWDLGASVDVSLRRSDDPMPTDTRERLFPLDLADHLLGRRSDSQDIHPEIVINDPGISRRHLRILRGAGGALSLLDLGSTNGTRLNDQAVEPNLPTPLREGDEITLGCWTRLKLLVR